MRLKFNEKNVKNCSKNNKFIKKKKISFLALDNKNLFFRCEQETQHKMK